MQNDIPYDNHLAHSVKRLYHLMGQYFNDALRPYGVARSQWYMLYYLHQSGGLTQKELQRVLQVEFGYAHGGRQFAGEKGVGDAQAEHGRPPGKSATPDAGRTRVMGLTSRPHPGGPPADAQRHQRGR